MKCSFGQVSGNCSDLNGAGASGGHGETWAEVVMRLTASCPCLSPLSTRLSCADSVSVTHRPHSHAWVYQGPTQPLCVSRVP